MSDIFKTFALGVVWAGGIMIGLAAGAKVAGAVFGPSE